MIHRRQLHFERAFPFGRLKVPAFVRRIARLERLVVKYSVKPAPRGLTARHHLPCKEAKKSHATAVEGDRASALAFRSRVPFFRPNRAVWNGEGGADPALRWQAMSMIGTTQSKGDPVGVFPFSGTWNRIGSGEYGS